MKKILFSKGFGIGMILLAIMLVTTQVFGDAGIALAKSDKVTLCQATGSESNPYTKVTVNVSSLGNGHGHSGVNDGDIIPPTPGTDFPNGQNWDATHQGIYNNNCNVPEPPHDVTICWQGQTLGVPASTLNNYPGYQLGACPPPVCQWDPAKLASDPTCVEPPPPACEWDPAKLASDPTCVEPPPPACQWDPSKLASDPTCVAPVTPPVLHTYCSDGNNVYVHDGQNPPVGATPDACVSAKPKPTYFSCRDDLRLMAKNWRFLEKGIQFWYRHKCWNSPAGDDYVRDAHGYRVQGNHGRH